jgi:hypothetical protein
VRARSPLAVSRVMYGTFRNKTCDASAEFSRTVRQNSDNLMIGISPAVGTFDLLLKCLPFFRLSASSSSNQQ